MHLHHQSFPFSSSSSPTSALICGVCLLLQTRSAWHLQNIEHGIWAVTQLHRPEEQGRAEEQPHYLCIESIILRVLLNRYDILKEHVINLLGSTDCDVFCSKNFQRENGSLSTFCKHFRFSRAIVSLNFNWRVKFMFQLVFWQSRDCSCRFYLAAIMFL